MDVQKAVPPIAHKKKKLTQVPPCRLQYVGISTVERWKQKESENPPSRHAAALYGQKK